MNDPFDDEIDRLARALADETDGRSSASDATLASILAAPQPKPASRTWMLAAAAVLVLAVGTPTAWAWWTGVIGGVSETTVPDAPAPSATPPRAPSVVPTRVDEPSVPPTLAPTSIVPEASAPLARETAHAETTRRTPELGPAELLAPVEDLEEEAIEEALPPVDAAERRAYEEAHALHFGARDPGGALVAWDRYLADHPSGRFAVEARYNRALTLVRLGRRGEARTALETFAEGAHGAYRQREARALIDAMDRADP